MSTYRSLKVPCLLLVLRNTVWHARVKSRCHNCNVAADCGLQVDVAIQGLCASMLARDFLHVVVLLQSETAWAPGWFAELVRVVLDPSVWFCFATLSKSAEQVVEEELLKHAAACK